MNGVLFFQSLEVVVPWSGNCFWTVSYTHLKCTYLFGYAAHHPKYDYYKFVPCCFSCCGYHDDDYNYSCLLYTSMRDLYGFDVTNVDLALIGQQAEHEFCGVNCGIMDPVSYTHLKRISFSTFNSCAWICCVFQNMDSDAAIFFE